MKNFVIIFTFMISIAALAAQENISEEKALKIARAHAERNDYFTALDSITSFYIYKTPEKKVRDFIESMTEHTGTHYFNTFRDIQLRKINTPTTQLIMAKRNMYLKKWEHGIRRLSKFPKDHWLYAEALMTLGSIYALKGDANLAHKTYQSCVEEANKREKKSEYNTQKYFAMIKESCFIDQARIYYRSGEFQKAVDHYRKVPKTSYKWPYILIEMAWAHYNLGDYNRSLGLLITYNSPLLQSYFMPEAEVLKALNYFKLCLYQDALIVVQNFYDVYKPKSDQLLSVITKGQKDPLYYYNLMFSPLEDIEKESQFLRNIVTQTSTRVKFNLDINSLQALEVEILRGNKMVNSKRLSNMQKDLKEQINHYVKVSFHKFINEIHKLSYEMFNIKLEVLSQQRDLVYKNKDLDANRSRGSLDNVKRGYKEEFWMFKQEFWADELGDYSFGLKSACEKKGA